MNFERPAVPFGRSRLGGRGARALLLAALLLLAACVPEAPVHLRAEARNLSVVLDWVANVEADLDGYRLFRDGALLATLPANATRYVDTAVTDGVEHRYVLRAVSTLGEVSAPSVEVAATPRAVALPMEHIVVSADGEGFAGAVTGAPFVAYGFNYSGSGFGAGIVEDTWELAFPEYVADLRYMVELGATTTRIALQVSRFMDGPTTMNAAAMQRLEDALDAAEQVGIRVMLCGLNAYVGAEDPAWYLALSEQERWDAQAYFWRQIAARVGHSPAIFAYDLMNEPSVPSVPETDWTPGEFGGYSFSQRLVLDPTGRDLDAVVRAWITKMRDAIRAEDAQHLITIGLLPFWQGPLGAANIVDLLDFLSPHLYPRTGRVTEQLALLERFRVGKPVHIGETYVLHCTREELAWFLRAARPRVGGVFGHFMGETIAEMTPPEDVVEAVHRESALLFQEVSFEMKAAAPVPVPLFTYSPPENDRFVYAASRDDGAQGALGLEYRGASGGVLSSDPGSGAVPLCAYTDTATSLRTLDAGCDAATPTNVHQRTLGWAFPDAAAGTVPLRRYLLPNGARFYTTADFDDVADEYGIAFEGVEAHVFP